MTLARSPRWRRALLAATFPYLLLSVFADFVHVDRIVEQPVAQGAVHEHIGTATQAPNVPDSSCPVCQWLRAGTGIPIAVAVGRPAQSLTADVVARLPRTPSKPVLLSSDFRGPPRTIFV